MKNTLCEAEILRKLTRAENVGVIFKAIIPVAGWGTRMLPVTKSIEKCMLPVGTRPVIWLYCKMLCAAGVKDLYFVVVNRVHRCRSYYRSSIQLNDYLRRAVSRTKLLWGGAARRRIHFVTQAIGWVVTAQAFRLRFWRANLSNKVSRLFVIMGDQCFWRDDGGSNAAWFGGVGNRADCRLGYWKSCRGIYSQTGIKTDDQGNFVRIIEKPKLEGAQVTSAIQFLRLE